MLESGIGPQRLLLLYFICGVAASLLSLVFTVYRVSAGASGAIFGLYGYQLCAILLATYRDREKLNPVLVNFAIFVVVNSLIASGGSVDIWAHLGGAVAGIIIAFCHFKLGKLRSLPAMVIVLVATPFLAFFVPKDQLHLYRVFHRANELEQLNRRLFREIRNDIVLGDSLRKVQKQWKAVDSSLTKIPSVRASLHEDTAIVHQYVRLQYQDTEYRLRILDESYIYMDSLEGISARFEKIPRLQHLRDFSFIPDQPEEPDTTQHKNSTPPGTPVRVFYDKNWKEIDDENFAEYYRMGSRDSLNRWQGPVRDYFKSGDIQMKGSYTDGLRDGVFLYYSNRRTYTSAGRYSKEYSTGKWELFHWNGKLEREMYYGDRTFTKTVYDSLGNTQVANGNGHYTAWYGDGTVKEEGTFTNGLRTGTWRGYREDGKPYYEESYRDNRFINGISQGRDGRRYVYDALSEFPSPEGGLVKYHEYLYRERHFPPGDSVHGSVKVLFTVGTDGTRWDYVILKSLSPFCDAEAIRLIKDGPAWRPALLHGQEKIQSQGYVEVTF
jgi:antitoxin component YwqK of YwqJK toxin-antitoxin module